MSTGDRDTRPASADRRHPGIFSSQKVNPEHYAPQRPQGNRVADLFVLVGQMHGAGDAGTEAADGAQHFEALLRVVPLVTRRRRLVGAGLAPRIPPPGVLWGRHHGLVVADLAVVDDDPVRQTAA